MYVCLCHGVTDKQVREAIATGATSEEEVAECTGAGTRCGSCRSMVGRMVDEALEAGASCGRRLRVLSPAA